MLGSEVLGQPLLLKRQQAVEKLPWWLLSSKFRHQTAPSMPLLGRFEPDLWSLPAQSRLFQQADKLRAVLKSKLVTKIPN
jgi:hypothetical protein